VTTVSAALNQARTRLDAVDARLLLQHVTGLSHPQLITRGEQCLDPDQAARFAALVARRAAGEPVAYLLGRREFHGLDLQVTPDVLIPRPDTELLVDLALPHLAGKSAPAVLDLGTGSGAVALAVKHGCPAARVTAVDASNEALLVARGNGARLDLAVEWLAGDWFGPVGGRRFDVIVGNPPYVAEHDPHLAQGDLRFEPKSALAAGPDGLDEIRRIVAAAPAHLQAGGWLLLEHGFDQAAAVRELCRAAGLAAVDSWRDLAGIERVSGGQRMP